MNAPPFAAKLVLATALLLASSSCHSESQLHSSSHDQEAQAASPLGIGRAASGAEISAWDIDVRPDGTGLPAGRGTVEEGRRVYSGKCAACHGATGVEGPDTRLVGRIEGDAFPFGEELQAVKTIGNYWPYATTIFDYVRRAMPFDAPGSLSADEVYAVTAYLLSRNGIIPEDLVMDSQTLPAVQMPARDRFVPDDRKGGPEVR